MARRLADFWLQFMSCFLLSAMSFESCALHCSAQGNMASIRNCLHPPQSLPYFCTQCKWLTKHSLTVRVGAVSFFWYFRTSGRGCLPPLRTIVGWNAADSWPIKVAPLIPFQVTQSLTLWEEKLIHWGSCMTLARAK